ncbi:MAG: hypothetical protein Q9N67_05600 [Ghiorsea sp.]|nr:hypothetical protein [Ghiorsea sp.]MDQ7004399.1 hypothetical protein [Ghiorsea sp.]
MNPMAKPQTYVGVDNDLNGGMTVLGKLVRDAWVFGLLEETETCEGWDGNRIDVLLQKVNAEWDKYGCMVSHLPPELFERHQRIHDKAFAKAKDVGWNGERETDDEA